MLTTDPTTGFSSCHQCRGCTCTLCGITKSWLPELYTCILYTHIYQRKAAVNWRWRDIWKLCWQVELFVVVNFARYEIGDLDLKLFIHFFFLIRQCPSSLLISAYLFLCPLPSGTESFVGGTSAIYHAAPSEFKWTYFYSHSALIYPWRYSVLMLQFR